MKAKYPKAQSAVINGESTYCQHSASMVPKNWKEICQLKIQQAREFASKKHQFTIGWTDFVQQPLAIFSVKAGETTTRVRVKIIQISSSKRSPCGQWINNADARVLILKRGLQPNKIWCNFIYADHNQWKTIGYIVNRNSTNTYAEIDHRNTVRHFRRELIQTTTSLFLVTNLLRHKTTTRFPIQL